MDLKTPQQWTELLDSVDSFIFDCDGRYIKLDPHICT